MIRYVIALFLINTYSSSLGAPAVLQTSSTTIANLLNSLGKNCGNLFIKSQIEMALQNCSNPDHNTQYQCLIFYDINSQLCSAINKTKNFDLNEEEFLIQVKKVFDVNDLCNYAHNWTFSSNYGMNVSLSSVFQDPVKCEKLCGVYDVFSLDTNEFCKYFNWGWKKLNPLKKTTSQSILNKSPVGANSQEVNNTETGQRVTSGISDKQPPTLNQNEEQDLSDIEVPTSSKSSEANLAQTLPTVTIVSTNVPSQGLKTIENAKQSSDNVAHKPETINTKSNVTSQLKPQPVQSHKIEDDNGEESFANEMDADDEDNVDDSDLAENPIVPKEIQTAEFTHKEFYSPELTPEDDHFFPFFLTAIVLVVLVYILYHNKGRVTKVILGLIVEGRQSGRRRNSRGHAYRRLDTLEQAMSGNLSAQPSKIIY
ncbi:trans-Golgi network integral membrane protein 1-like [Plodia interpunctella]|uniref:trans-Golgi network integral membrane protein 1-like n=1 Tax=Plodia interpunctella TaxID=58824 RepID=UPI002368D8A6|nr:trans-Golgi network integral membrane protein 1-like [Plodia interpunctella]